MDTRKIIKRELSLLVGLLLTGLIAIPIAVYWVGQQIVGPYEGSGGLMDLIGQIFGDLWSLRLSAWSLVLSPYLIVQCLRAAAYIYRRSGNVSSVTNSEESPTSD